jgi:hypothetical protein
MKATVKKNKKKCRICSCGATGQLWVQEGDRHTILCWRCYRRLFS